MARQKLLLGLEGDPVGLHLVSTAGCKLSDDVCSSGTAKLISLIFPTTERYALI